MRRKYVAVADGGWCEVITGSPPEPRNKGVIFMPDMKPYKSIINGREITSRSRHREHLRENNAIEVGNEKMPALVDRSPRPEGLRQDMQRAWDQLSRR